MIHRSFLRKIEREKKMRAVFISLAQGSSFMNLQNNFLEDESEYNSDD
jgi:hypothetical protein